MGQDEDLTFTLVKALISGGVNLALPGVGSLVGIGIGLFPGKRKEFEEEVGNELAAALQAARSAEKERLRDRLRKRVFRAPDKKTRRMLEELGGFDTLMQAEARVAGHQLPAEEWPPPGEGEDAAWAALGRAQLKMARTSGFVPGCWQDELAVLLKEGARNGLTGPGRAEWRTLIGAERDRPDPREAELASWAKNVTRIFALRLESNPKLRPLAQELHRKDQEALQRALLRRLDQQRRSLQLIAGALCALLVALGIEVDVLDL